MTIAMLMSTRLKRRLAAASPRFRHANFDRLGAVIEKNAPTRLTGASARAAKAPSRHAREMGFGSSRRGRLAHNSIEPGQPASDGTL